MGRCVASQSSARSRGASQSERAALDEEDAVADPECERAPLLAEHDGRAALARQTLDQLDQRHARPRGRAARSARRGAAAPARGRACSRDRRAGARRRTARPRAAPRAARRPRTRAPQRRDPRSPQAARRHSRCRTPPRPRRRRTRPGPPGPGRAWRPCRRARRAAFAACRGRPISTLPEKRPPWKCGTSPASARTSVVLPEPDGPSTSTISPGSIDERDVGERRPARPRRTRTTRSGRTLEPHRTHDDEQPSGRQRGQPSARPPARRRRPRRARAAVAAGFHRLREVDRALERPRDDGRRAGVPGRGRPRRRPRARAAPRRARPRRARASARAASRGRRRTPTAWRSGPSEAARRGRAAARTTANASVTAASRSACTAAPASSSDVTSSRPSTGTVGPLQSTCEPSTTTSGVTTSTAPAVSRQPTRYGRRLPFGARRQRASRAAAITATTCQRSASSATAASAASSASAAAGLMARAPGNGAAASSGCASRRLPVLDRDREHDRVARSPVRRAERSGERRRAIDEPEDVRIRRRRERSRARRSARRSRSRGRARAPPGSSASSGRRPSARGPRSRGRTAPETRRRRPGCRISLPAPRPVVPPDHVARAHRVLGGAPVGLDPVHEVEPAAPARPRRPRCPRCRRRSGRRTPCRRTPCARAPAWRSSPTAPSRREHDLRAVVRVTQSVASPPPLDPPHPARQRRTSATASFFTAARSSARRRLRRRARGSCAAPGQALPSRMANAASRRPSASPRPRRHCRRRSSRHDLVAAVGRPRELERRRPAGVRERRPVPEHDVAGLQLELVGADRRRRAVDLERPAARTRNVLRRSGRSGRRTARSRSVRTW